MDMQTLYKYFEIVDRETGLPVETVAVKGMDAMEAVKLRDANVAAYNESSVLPSSEDRFFATWF